MLMTPQILSRHTTRSIEAVDLQIVLLMKGETTPSSE